MGEFEKFFNNEVKSKKYTINSNRARTGRRGSKGSRKVMFATDTMSKKDFKEYTKAGRVETYNMYETILTKDEFDLKPVDTQKAMLTRWREIYSNEKIMQEMNINGVGTFYGILKDLDIPKKTRGGYRGRKVSQKPSSTPVSQPVNNNEIVQKLISNGLHLEYNGKYDSEQLSKIFTKLQLLIDGEDNEFYLSISLSEADK